MVELLRLFVLPSDSEGDVDAPTAEFQDWFDVRFERVADHGDVLRPDVKRLRETLIFQMRLV